MRGTDKVHEHGATMIIDTTKVNRFTVIIKKIFWKYSFREECLYVVYNIFSD